MNAVIILTILIIVGAGFLLVPVLAYTILRKLGQRTKNTYIERKTEAKPSAKKRNYREWKVAGLKSRKGLYIKDKNLCPCGSGLQYTDCCGK